MWPTPVFHCLARSHIRLLKRGMLKLRPPSEFSVWRSQIEFQKKRK
jgi:hypothetical protein